VVVVAKVTEQVMHRQAIQAQAIQAQAIQAQSQHSTNSTTRTTDMYILNNGFRIVCVCVMLLVYVVSY